MKIITVEEHFMSKEVNDIYNKIVKPKTELEKAKFEFVNNLVNKGEITNLSDERINFMDENGVDIQIVGYGNNSPMHLKKEDGAVDLCKKANDELFKATKKYKGRIYGYATLPICDEEESVKELERCINHLDFKGVMLNGDFEGHFLDEERFYPIFKKCDELDIPVYLHPTEVFEEISNKYYIGNWNIQTANIFAGYGIGWHYDTAIYLLRLILSGIFDKLPNLKVIAGHWGELLPFYFERMNFAFNAKVTGLKHDIKYYFNKNIYTNPSGMFFKDDFDFVLKTFNKENIMYVPQESFASLFGNNNGFGVLMAATLGVPIYVCGGGTIPLLNEWLHSGMSMGAGTAFMVTGPATKITNLGALKIVLGIKHFIIYLAYVILFALLSGLFIDIIGITV